MPSSNNSPQEQLCRWHGYATTQELERSVVQVILHASRQAINQHGAFHIVLAGGTTPRRIYELLREADAEWNAWHVYFGDERCLPPEHPERNSFMAATAWLDHVPIPAEQVHPVPAELGAEPGAARYLQDLYDVEQFDLVLLGLGEDGHTASLFPGHGWGTMADAPDTLVVHNAPKPPPDRISLSAHRLGMARQVCFLVTGKVKRQAVQQWQSGAGIPAAAITPPNGVDIHIEQNLLN